MKKLVLKTVAITLAAVLCLSLIVYGIIALSSPITLAKAYDGLGWYKPAVRYYENQYEKTQSNDDLFVLCTKVNEYTDSQRAVKYLGELIEKEDYLDYCEKVDKQQKDQDFTTENFIDGKYVVAVFSLRGMSKAITQAKKMIENGYDDYNPFFLLYTDANLNLTKEQLTALKSEISTLTITLPSSAERLRAVNDLANVKKLLESME